MPSRWISYLNLRLALHIQLTTPARKEHRVVPGLLREPRLSLVDADGLHTFLYRPRASRVDGHIRRTGFRGNGGGPHT